MDSIHPDYFINAANILLLVAYSVRDILWLRSCAVAASVIAIPYFVLQPATLWPPLTWSVVFAAINLYQALRIVAERRPVKLTQEEEEVQRIIPELAPRKLLQILNIGSWITAEKGELLIKSGEPAEAISLIVRGRAQVAKGERVLGELAAGDLLGSALLLSGVPAQFDAVVMESIRAMSWKTDTLERYLAANPDMRTIMLQHLARDLAAKVMYLGKERP